MERNYLKKTFAFARNFKDDTQGSMTVFGLFFFLFSGILGAIALDVTSLYADRTHLQIAADEAAHAALYNLNTVGLDEDAAKATAIALVSKTLPTNKYGTTIEVTDIDFGTWDNSARVFTAAPGAKGAARATTSFTDARFNAARSYLFRLIGIDKFDVITSGTMMATDAFECATDGFFAKGTIDMNNQNQFGNGFCLVSETTLKIQPNNIFDEGSVVLLPDGCEGLTLPDEFVCGSNVNDIGNLEDAVGDNYGADMKMLSRIENLIAGYEGDGQLPVEGIAGDEISWPDYITLDPLTGDPLPSEIEELLFSDYSGGNAPNLLAEDLDPGKVYVLDDCPSANGNGQNSSITIEGDATGVFVEEVVFVTNCVIKFENNLTIENSRIITTSTNPSSFSAPSGLTLGGSQTNDEGKTCETANTGVQIVTAGGINFAADFNAYDSQVFALGDVQFAATPSSTIDFKGTSVYAGGDIDMASHVSAQVGCHPGLGNNDLSETKYFLVN